MDPQKKKKATAQQWKPEKRWFTCGPYRTFPFPVTEAPPLIIRKKVLLDRNIVESSTTITKPASPEIVTELNNS